MFKYFVGNIHLLDAPSESEDVQLDIEFPEKILGALDKGRDSDQLTDRQVERIIECRAQMSAIIGDENFARIKRDNILQDSDADFLLRLAMNMRNNPDERRGFGYLNSSKPDHWDNILYKILRLKSGNWDAPFGKLVTATKTTAHNWDRDLPQLITTLKGDGFFQTRTDYDVQIGGPSERYKRTSQDDC